MSVLLPLSGMAADAVGMMTSVGTVIVDNQPAVGGGAVFSGDVIETRSASKAVVSGRGRTITLAENSSLKLGATNLELQSGAVVISGNSILQIDTVIVTAASAGPAKFLARKVNGTVQVLSLEGTLTVDNGQERVQVPATKGVSIGGVGHRMSWLLNDDIGIIIVVAAAITAGVVLGVVNSQNAKPVSPAAP